MKVVILAGGYGTRLSEETIIKPKPMVEIGNKPLLWHIMNIYAAYGYKEFIVALGYKGEVIKDYFLNYYHYQNDLSINLKNGEVGVVNNHFIDDWVIHLVNTGLNTQTGGRLARLRSYLKGEAFMLTYGDGVGNVDISRLIEFHRSHKKIATVTSVHPVARFGEINLESDRVVEFKEKPQTGEGWINGGFFVFEPAIFDYLENDETVLEGTPLENLAKDGQLMAYKHDGFWQCVDTLRDKQLLEKLWKSGNAPWVMSERKSLKKTKMVD
jgi:glucose-1-phosphate cytidylyltransferase